MRVPGAPVSFWCSRCQKSHAGECPPVAVSQLGRPPIGSRWHVRYRCVGQSRWYEPRPDSLVFEVVGYDSQESGTVDTRVVGEPLGHTYRAPDAAFHGQTYMPSDYDIAESQMIPA